MGVEVNHTCTIAPSSVLGRSVMGICAKNILIFTLVGVGGGKQLLHAVVWRKETCRSSAIKLSLFDNSC